MLGPHARVAVNTAVSNQTKGAVPAFLAEDASLTLQPPFSVVSSALVQVLTRVQVQVPTGVVTWILLSIVLAEVL